MGAKTWMLVYADGSVPQQLRSHPELDRSASESIANRLFPKETLTRLEDGDLSFTSPPDNELLVGAFAGATILAAAEFAGDKPSALPSAFVEESRERSLYLHAMHSVVDFFAYGVWQDRKLQRALSLSPDSGIIENIGVALPFEEPYWAGSHPAIDPAEADEIDYPFLFHPLDLGEAALAAMFGYHLEGPVEDGLIKPESIPLARFRRSKARWKLW
jgi:hypothetical protein